MTQQLPVTIAHNAVNARLVNASRAVKLAVRQKLSYLVDGAEHTGAFKSHNWDGMSSFFDFEKETFPAGFVYLVYADLLRLGFKVNLVRKPFPEPLGDEKPIVDNFGTDDPKYDYQYEVPKKLLKHGQIIAQIATGGGKSRIAKICYARIGRPTMFLTTRGILMYQMRDAVKKDMKQRVGVIGDDHWDENPFGFNVCMVQTLAPLMERWTDAGRMSQWLKSREESEDREIKKLVESLKRKKTPLKEISVATMAIRERQKRERPADADLVELIKKQVIEHNAKHEKALAFLSKMELVILEEAHESSGDGYYQILRRCGNAHYRLALTATPFMKDSAEANMRLMACSGPVAVRVTEKELIDRGVLAKPYFKFVPLSVNFPSYTDENGRKHTLFRSTPWPKCYEIGIAHNEERNRRIVAEVARAVSYGLTAMVLVNYKEHGKNITRMLTEAGLRTNFIFGEHDQTERQAALNALKDGRLDVLVGSTILDVGVDVPAIGLIVLAGAGKAEVAVRQRIGRGLRRKHKGPNVAFVVDFGEPLNNHLRDHARERQGIISGTPGFKEGIVSDFDYEGLGFVKKGSTISQS